MLLGRRGVVVLYQRDGLLKEESFLVASNAAMVGYVRDLQQSALLSRMRSLSSVAADKEKQLRRTQADPTNMRQVSPLRSGLSYGWRAMR